MTDVCRHPQTAKSAKINNRSNNEALPPWRYVNCD
jgi:hypothetical protein